MRKRTVRTAVVTLTLLALVAGGVYVYRYPPHSVTSRGAETLPHAPDFSLPDITGTPIVLSEVHARVRIVNFWASWSPYSHDELLALSKVKDVYGSDVEIIAVDRDTNENDGRAYLAALGVADKVTFVFDAGDTYFKQVGGFNMPETLFLDEQGGIVAHTHGPTTYDGVDTQVRSMLGR